MTGERAHAPRGRFASQVPGQRGLADAGLATKKDEPSMTGARRGQLLAKEDLLALPADEYGERVA